MGQLLSLFKIRTRAAFASSEARAIYDSIFRR